MTIDGLQDTLKLIRAHRQLFDARWKVRSQMVTWRWLAQGESDIGASAY